MPVRVAAPATALVAAALRARVEPRARACTRTTTTTTIAASCRQCMVMLCCLMMEEEVVEQVVDVVADVAEPLGTRGIELAALARRGEATRLCTSACAQAGG